MTMAIFSSLQRDEMAKELQKRTTDVLVIGGGITGAGMALDAASRGLRAGLVEMQDFSSGTSSRSTKLVHGGLRYLQQLDVKIVAEVGKERAIVYENGPHVTTPEWMMLPFHKGGTFGPYSTNVGLLVYDFLAGVKKKERRKMFSPEVALEKEPLIKRDNLKGAGYYVEYKTDDARLTIEVIKKAVEYGAKALNYTKVIDYIYNDNNKMIGVTVEDQITKEQYNIYAKKIINAAGPWVDQLMNADGTKNGEGLKLHLTKGVHLVFDKEDFPLQQAIYFDSPDGRMIFAIPRDNITYVGTTDTTYRDDIAHPTFTEEDEEYLLDAINYMFPTVKLDESHVKSSWAGLRPLIAQEGKDPSEISRKDEVFVSDSGLISIAGGKLTGYRKMGEDVINTVVKQLKKEEGILYSRSHTKTIPIAGGEVGGSIGFKKFKEEQMERGLSLGIDEETMEFLIHAYGANSTVVINTVRDQQAVAEEHDLDPVVFAQLTYALEHELAYKPTDFFIRRTGALFFEIEWVNKHKESVIRYMAKMLGWTGEQEDEYRAELEKSLEEAVQPSK